MFLFPLIYGGKELVWEDESEVIELRGEQYFMAFPLFIFALYCTSWLLVLWPSKEHASKLKSELGLYTALIHI